jgi:hypothetical protein
VRIQHLVVASCVVLVAACSSGDDDDDAGTTDAPASTTAPEPTTTTTTIAAAASLCAAPAPTQVGTVADAAIVELSGLAVSRTNTNELFAHNDSGAGPDVYVLDRTGATTRRVTLAGADAVDWEDIAAQDGVLYVGDIGDNAAQRPEIVVYRLPEPGAAGEVEAERIVLHYADGPHDAEALFIDPVEQQLVIVTKALDGNSGVYATPLDTSAPLERVADLSLGAAQLVTAGDISAAGAVIALRTYGTVFVWDRQEGETIAEAFAREPCQAPSAIETQGEALALELDGRGFVTSSEGQNPAIWVTTASAG